MTREPLDLRLAPVALATWGAAAIGVGWPPGRALLGASLLLAVSAFLVRRGRRPAGVPAPPGRHAVVAGALLAAAAALAVAGLRGQAVAAGPLPDLAEQRAYVRVEAVVITDPVTRRGSFAPYTVVRLRVVEVLARRGMPDTAVRSPVLVIGGAEWTDVDLGDRVEASGRLQPAQGRDLSAVLTASTPPVVRAPAGRVLRGVAAVRAGVRDAAEPLPPAERALIPALVDGDDGALPPDVVDGFSTTGLTHLLAVSGSNLTIVLAFVLAVARWSGVRARGLVVVGLAAVVFFVLLARPSPSVLRAAAMGVVALAGLSSGGRRRGVRALSLAVAVLVLLDPTLSRSIGFLLSTTATAGILLLAPAWRDALARWLPRPLAEAVAVPMAAQIACTPAVAAISGQVSVVAVVANLLVAPAVGPTTVLGLVAGLIALVSDPVATVAGRLAWLPAGWIVTVAERGADLAGASLGWPATGAGIATLTVACLALVAVLPKVLSSWCWTAVSALTLGCLVVQPVGGLGWPPPGWVMVMCDVGQGDGLVLNAGSRTAVVIDAGPEPRLMDRCLDRLEVDAVALVVLTHFHADHVNGLPGVLDGRPVAEIQTTGLRDPPDRAAAVAGWARSAGAPVTIAVVGERRTVGSLTWTVLGPLRTAAGAPSGSQEGSAPNNASVVMLVESQGHRLLLSGDAEPEEESDILATGVDLRVDVFKVAHHGSANQEPDFVAATQAPLALVSVGAGNDYGHPSPQTLALLDSVGARTYRTDRDGDIAVVDRAGSLAVTTSD